MGDLAVRPPLDHHGSLIVARDPGAEQIELRLVADLPGQLRLAQRGVRLLERASAIVDETIGEGRVVVGRGDVQQQLRRADVRPNSALRTPAFADWDWPFSLPASEQRLAEGEAEAEGVLPPERQVVELGERIGVARALHRGLQRVEPLLHGSPGWGTKAAHSGRRSGPAGGHRPGAPRTDSAACAGRRPRPLSCG